MWSLCRAVPFRGRRRCGRTRWVHLTGTLALAVLAFATEARAEETAETPDEPPPPRIVRVAISKQAEAFLTEGRVRRLIDLELPSATKLADEPTGPLDENAVHLYIDLPEPSVVTIQAQAPQRKVETRRVDVAGLAWDVAARLTAVAASESVRSELEPIRRRPTKPREPSDDALRTLFRTTPAVSVSGSVEGAILPDVGGLGGSRVAVGFHQPYFTEELSLAALGGGGSRGSMRWVEGSIGLGYRLYYSSRLRSHLGADFAFAHVDFHGIGGHEGDFNMRAAARASIEVRPADRVWLSLAIEPGGVLLDAPRGTRGGWFGAAIAISYDALLGGTVR
jgi:hypothetical protein